MAEKYISEECYAIILIPDPFRFGKQILVNSLDDILKIGGVKHFTGNIFLNDYLDDILILG